MWKTTFRAKFAKKATDDIIEEVKKRLVAANLMVKEVTSTKSKRRAILINAPDDIFYKEAELQQLMKMNKETKSLEDFSAEDKEDFVDFDKENFFLPSEQVHMLRDILDTLEPDHYFVSIIEKGRTEKKKKKKIKFQGHESIFQLCARLGIMDELYVEHDKEEKTRVWKKLKWSFLRSPVHLIRNYYGEEVAFYFGWMNFYMLWLIPAAVFGILLPLTRPDDVTIDTAPYVPFFALGMVIWGFFFIKLWARQTAKYSYQWDTYDRVKMTQYRSSFYGVWRKSPITGETELYYPQYLRRYKYIVSVLVTLVMLVIAFSVMICSLNLQGYVSEYSPFGAVNPFHIACLHQFSMPGAIFDPMGPLFLVPVVIHAIVIIILNQMIYSRIATRLTDWENHKTDESYENSLILKRFLFEAFDCYIALFYLAFYERDIARLRKELMALYTSDCIRRVATETIIPLVMQTVKRKKSKDTEKIDMEMFNDYLEMVIQYGYIMLFASAFPSAAALSLFSNIIEMKSDGFKLSFLLTRPQVHRVKSIGTWHTVLTIQTWIAVLTNAFLFGFSSDQMLQWFPSYFEFVDVTINGITTIQHQMVNGLGRYAVCTVFGVEHVLILIGLAIFFFIKDVPKDVQVAIAKREYLQAKEVKKLRHASKIQTRELLDLKETSL